MKIVDEAYTKKCVEISTVTNLIQQFFPFHSFRVSEFLFIFNAVAMINGLDINILVLFRPGTNCKSPNADDSFGQEILCATNSIFSSFQNSRKVLLH